MSIDTPQSQHGKACSACHMVMTVTRMIKHGEHVARCETCWGPGSVNMWLLESNILTRQCRFDTVGKTTRWLLGKKQKAALSYGATRPVVFERTNVEFAMFREASGKMCLACFERTTVEACCVQLAFW